MKPRHQYFLPVLLADDDMDDRMLFQDAINEIDFNISLQLADDGEELMEYLLNSAIILPEILFLDLNMPRKSGFECLEEIRGNKMLHDIFIIIYSTTASEKEIKEVYSKGANLFFNKPNSFTELKIALTHLFKLDLREHFADAKKENFVLTVNTVKNLS